MGMYDTIYAELDCPFCGKQYRHTPLTWEEAEREIKEHKQHLFDRRQADESGKKSLLLVMQPVWAEQDGFDDVDAWIAQLDGTENIEEQRTRPYLGLAEIQTKALECVLAEYYVGDEVPAYLGHYFIPESFECRGCSHDEARVYVKVWVEIEDRRIKTVQTHDPETGEPGQEVFPRRPWQGMNQAGDKSLMDRFTPKLSPEFSTPDGHLVLKDLGQTLHERLHTVCRHLPTDFETYGKRERNGPDCSCGCKHFLTLPGKLGLDWGVCIHPRSPRSGLLTFEHQGCEFFESTEDDGTA